MTASPFKFVTDTATMCIFDPEALRHRFWDDADWWSLPSDEVSEMNSGNIAFINLGADGQYTVNFEEPHVPLPEVQCNITCPSGRVFIGAAEETTSDGLEPECIRGGTFLHVNPGNYLVSVARRGPYDLRLRLEVAVCGSNFFEHPLTI